MIIKFIASKQMYCEKRNGPLIFIIWSESWVTVQLAMMLGCVAVLTIIRLVPKSLIFCCHQKNEMLTSKLKQSFVFLSSDSQLCHYLRS